MSGLITQKTGEMPADRPTPKSLCVNGIRYSNAAAKFWPSLIDEVAEDFSNCTTIELIAPAANPLVRSLLFPVIAMEEGMNALKGANLRDVMNDTLAELELLGLPAPVRIRLLAAEKEILATDLPLDCIDADTFPYLVAWPLEWAELPSDGWNRDAVAGRFTGEDRRRGIIYGVSFHLTNTHLKEGLYRRSLTIEHTVSMLA